MTSETEMTKLPGVLFGADGAAYFIPDEDMETFRLPDDQAGRALKLIDEDEVAGYTRREFRRFTARRGSFGFRRRGGGKGIIDTNT